MENMDKELTVKVSKSQNKFMKSSFLPKNERNIARISALHRLVQGPSFTSKKLEIWVQF